MEKVQIETVGFYYHIPFLSKNEHIWLPSYLGVFIDSLAQYVGKLVLFLHQTSDEGAECDYQLLSINIEIVSLGPKEAAWKRFFGHKRILEPIKNRFDFLDSLIVRSPSPLSPFFYKCIDSDRIVYLIVGDYAEVGKNISLSNLRKLGIKLFIHFYEFTFKQTVKNAKIIVNSHKLREKYIKISPNISLVQTTTLTQKSFYIRENTCNLKPIKLLYTGRIDRAKGLFEIIYALKELVTNNIEIEFHLVGWESKGCEVTNQLKKIISSLFLEERVFFHGRKKVGEELNEFYRNADIYIIPSYHEGFPRTIWEAMANSLPVIATNVGSIPYYLKNEESAILIEPRSSENIVKSIKQLLSDPSLRKSLIQNGLKLANNCTLDIQNMKLIEIISNKNEKFN